MRQHMFGWSLPPGCGRLPGEEPTPPCECCGKDPEGEGESSCICPECPLCGMVGNPECYNTERFAGHAPLTYSPEQLQGQAELQEEYRLQAEADKAEYESWAETEKAANEYWAEVENDLRKGERDGKHS